MPSVSLEAVAGVAIVQHCKVQISVYVCKLEFSCERRIQATDFSYSKVVNRS